MGVIPPFLKYCFISSPINNPNRFGSFSPAARMGRSGSTFAKGVIFSLTKMTTTMTTVRNIFFTRWEMIPHLSLVCCLFVSSGKTVWAIPQLTVLLPMTHSDHWQYNFPLSDRWDIQSARHAEGLMEVRSFLNFAVMIIRHILTMISNIILS